MSKQPQKKMIFAVMVKRMNKLKWAAFTMLALLFADVCISIIVFAGRTASLIALAALLIATAVVVWFLMVKC